MLKDIYYTEPTEVDKLVFEKLISADHYLRRVKEIINFEAFREQVKDCYSPTMGRGAEDPVRMMKLEFLQFHYNLSDREVMAEAQVNVAFRYFLDLSLDSALPVPSLLAQFRARLGWERHQRLFDEVVAQARQHGLVKDRLRLKDATHIIANIAVPSTIQLVAQVRGCLLESVQVYADVREHHQKAEQIRETTRDLKDVERLLHRVKHLQEIVSWADELQERLGRPTAGDKPRERLDQALALAHQVLADRQTGANEVRSLVDPEARRNKHGSYYDGYLLDVSVDASSELITALDVLPANADEAANAEELIKQEEAAHGNEIEEMSMDSIGFRGDVLRRLSDPTGLAVTVYVPPWQQPRKSDTFKPDDFVLDETKHQLICPGGKSTRLWSQQKHGRQFHFSVKDCRACPLLSQCVTGEIKHRGRSVFKSEYQVEYEAARERATTDRYVQVRSQHPKVERKLADLIRHHDGRRARYWGRGPVKIQYLLTGMVVNVKRIVKLLMPSPIQVVLQEG